MKNVLGALLVVFLLGTSSGCGEDLPGKVFGLWHFQTPHRRRSLAKEGELEDRFIELKENTYRLIGGSEIPTEVTVKDGAVYIVRTDTPFKEKPWVFRVIDDNTLEADFGNGWGLSGIKTLKRVTVEQGDAILAEARKRRLEREKLEEEKASSGKPYHDKFF